MVSAELVCWCVCWWCVRPSPHNTRCPERFTPSKDQLQPAVPYTSLQCLTHQPAVSHIPSLQCPIYPVYSAPYSSLHCLHTPACSILFTQPAVPIYTQACSAQYSGLQFPIPLPAVSISQPAGLKYLNLQWLQTPACSAQYLSLQSHIPSLQCPYPSLQCPVHQPTPLSLPLGHCSSLKYRIYGITPCPTCCFSDLQRQNVSVWL